MSQETRIRTGSSSTIDQFLKRKREGTHDEENSVFKKSSLTPRSPNKENNSFEDSSLSLESKILQNLTELRLEIKEEANRNKEELKSELLEIRKELN